MTGLVRPDAIWRNCTARPGDVLVLTKPLGVGILTTAMKADMVDEDTAKRIWRQMTTLNREAARIMKRYEVHSCTDVTGFSLMGHSLEMAAGSGCAVHLLTDRICYHPQAYEMAQMGFVPAGAYRNREYVKGKAFLPETLTRAMADILFDPQTSGGLLISVAEKDAKSLLEELGDNMDGVSEAGYVTEEGDDGIWLYCE